MRLLAFAIAAFALPAAAQTSSPDMERGAESVRSHEHYRETMIPTYMSDYGQLSRYRDTNSALGDPQTGERRVIFFGDSITDAWHLDQYFPGKNYINRGISGQTTSQMLVRFRQDVIDLQPAVVVILAGTNDIAGNTGPISIPDIEANYASLVEMARAQNFFAKRPPEKILALNAWLKSYCATNSLTYLDYFSALVDDRGLLKKDLAADGLHPSDAGYRIMTPLAESAIQQALAQR